MEWIIALFLIVAAGFWYVYGVLEKIYVLLSDWHQDWLKKNDSDFNNLEE